MLLVRFWPQQASESIQEFQRKSREVHDHIDGGRAFHQFWETFSHRTPDELSSVQVEGGDLCVHLVESGVVLKPAVGLGVEVIGENDAPPTGGRDSKRPDSGKHVKNHVSAVEQRHNPLVLRTEPRVPVHTRKIKLI